MEETSPVHRGEEKIGPLATASNAYSLTPVIALESMKQIQLVRVWFKKRKGGEICLPRNTKPELEQRLILHNLGWQLPKQPPPRILSGAATKG